MNDLKHDIIVTLNRNKSGSFATRKARREALALLADRLQECFKGLRLDNINHRHVGRIVQHIKTEPSARTGQPLSTGRQKNLLAHVRWLLEQVGKSNLLPTDNARLGIGRRAYVSQSSRAINATDELIEEIRKHSEFIACSMELSREFGLRFEESIKVKIQEANLGSELRLQGSWCKGGVPRRVPISTSSQRSALDRAAAISGTNSLCPLGVSYIEHARRARGLINQFGIHRVHGLRHAYAQRRYAELTGWACPACGGPLAVDMTQTQYHRDRAARMTISNELGHGRVAVTGVYLGSATLMRNNASIDTSSLID